MDNGSFHPSVALRSLVCTHACLFIRSSIRAFIRALFGRSFVCSSVHSFVHSLVPRSLTRSIPCSYVCKQIYSFIFIISRPYICFCIVCMPVPLFTPSFFVRSCAGSLAHSPRRSFVERPLSVSHSSLTGTG